MEAHTSFTSLNYKQAKVLVIEDQDDVWAITRVALRKGLPDVTAYRVATKQEALEFVATCLNDKVDLPKLVLQDLYLPRREDGFELLRELRTKFATCSCPQLPILVISSSTDPADIRESYRLGASCYLVKTSEIERQIANYQSLRHFWWETSVLPLTNTTDPS